MLTINISNARTLALLLVAGLAATATESASAACVMPPQSGDQTITAPTEFMVPQSMAVGTLIGKPYISSPSYSHPGVYCVNWNIKGVRTQDQPLWRDNIYYTNVPGIGVRLQEQSNGTPTNPIPFQKITSSTVELVNHGFMVEFYKIGQVKEDILTSERYAEIMHSGGSTMKLILPAIRFYSDAPTCDFRTVPDIDLGKIPASALTAADAATQWIEFHLDRIKCDSATRIIAHFNGTADKRSPTLFASNGTAEGIGLELHTADDVLVSPGDSVDYTTDAGAGTYALRTRLKRTSWPLSVGTVSSAITINLDYQ